MKISVVIPVYKAERFLEKAVESALQQEETGEVLLVEDGSPDNSLELCLALQKKHQKVKLLRHPNGVNRGAGATRNLGIENAAFEWVAFLDADDFYLPGRFAIASNIIKQGEQVDGVYEAIGMHFYDQAAKQKWLSGGGELLTTVHEPVRPKDLFESLISWKNGYIHLDGLLVRKNLVKVCGNFPEHLRLHQDTAFVLKLAASGQLFPGKLKEPVALRGIHADNRITQNPNAEVTRALLWETLLEWSIKKDLALAKQILIYKRTITASYQLARKKSATRFNKLDLTKHLCLSFINHPILFLGIAITSISSIVKHKHLRNSDIRFKPIL